MDTLETFAKGLSALPLRTSWYLAELAEAKGKQELFTKQAPQKLKVLREHALIESAVSSNRIEGVEVDRSRIGTLMFGRPALRDRDEEEIRGYRDALNLIHTKGKRLPVSEDAVLRLHRMCRGEIWDAGRYKEKDVDIIQTYPDGRSRVRFRTVPAAATPAALRRTAELWQEGLRERWVHPFVLLAALNLDFLCVHPFRDGNGRVSRLLLLLSCYHLDLEVGRYISLERTIEDNKERYYETLELSSQGWHEGKHDPWPYIDFLLFILKSAYQEFERRVGQLRSPRGAKTEMVQQAVDGMAGEFTLRELEASCPGVSRDMVRRVLRQMQQSAQVVCIGRGPGARWEKR